MRIEIPKSVLEILEELNKAKYEAYIVGGCVRDYLLGEEPADWDITTNATPDKVKEVFGKTVDTGIKHGTVTVIKKGIGYEVTTYRIDGEYEDSRHPKNVEFTASLEEDLKRRDFTINAMAYHPEYGLVDLFGGREDLDNKLIRAVGSARERFSEDALRMMRAVRFAAKLGFEIEADTYEAIKELAPTISKISAERIQVEMTKLLVSNNPYKFKMFYETGLTKVFMPEFDRTMETEQNHPHHQYSVGEHILHSLEYVPSDKVLRLTMLFHDIAKSETVTIDKKGITHFYGHQEKSGQMAENILKRLKYDNDTIASVYTLAANHDRDILPNKASVRRAMNRFGKELTMMLMQVKYADVMAQSMYKREEKLKLIDDVNEVCQQVIDESECFQLSMMAVSGRDLIEAGIAPGKQIGIILNEMLDDVLDNPEHNERTYLLDTYVLSKK